jgi:hypothetical protein
MGRIFDARGLKGQKPILHVLVALSLNGIIPWGVQCGAGTVSALLLSLLLWD